MSRYLWWSHCCAQRQRGPESLDRKTAVYMKNILKSNPFVAFLNHCVHMPRMLYISCMLGATSHQLSHRFPELPVGDQSLQIALSYTVVYCLTPPEAALSLCLQAVVLGQAGSGEIVMSTTLITTIRTNTAITEGTPTFHFLCFSNKISPFSHRKIIMMFSEYDLKMFQIK